MNIAIMCHNRKQELMVQFCTAYCGLLSKHTLCATNATGRMVAEATGLPVNLFLSHEHGGIEQIGQRIIYNEPRLKQPASYHDVCVAMENAAQNSMKGIITCTNDQVVSSDLTGFSETCIFDETAGIMLDNNFVKLIAWYDNEWGYTNKILDLMAYMHTADQSR